MLTVEHCLGPVEKISPHNHPVWGLDYCGGSDHGSIVRPLGRRRSPKTSRRPRVDQGGNELARPPDRRTCPFRSPKLDFRNS